MRQTLGVATLIPMLVLLGCGAEPCPQPSNAGQCALSGLVQDTTTPVTRLQLGSCGRLPVELCDTIGGLSCVTFRADDDWYGYSALVISSAASWQQLQRKWSGADPCVPNPPTDWTGTTLVLADIWATGSTQAGAAYKVLARPDGSPHLSFQLNFSSASDCDCLATDVVGLIVRSDKQPTVCMAAVPRC